MATYTLKDNDVVIDKLSGAVSLSYLKQDYDAITDTQHLFPPVMLIGDQYASQYKLCDPCLEENNCFDISNESFFSLISNLPSPDSESEINFFLNFYIQKNRTDKISSIMYNNDNPLFNMNWSIMTNPKNEIFTEYRIFVILFLLKNISKSASRKTLNDLLNKWGFINLVNFLNYIATIDGWKTDILELDTNSFFEHIYNEGSGKTLSNNTRLNFTNPSSYIKQFAPDEEDRLKLFYNILANKQLQTYIKYITEQKKLNGNIEMLDFILNQTDPKKLNEIIDDGTNYSFYFDFLFDIVAAPFIVIDFTMYLLNAKNKSTSFMFAFIEDKYLVMIQDFLNSFYNYKIIHDIRPNPKKEQYNCLEIDFLLNISDEIHYYNDKKEELLLPEPPPEEENPVIVGSLRAAVGTPRAAVGSPRAAAVPIPRAAAVGTPKSEEDELLSLEIKPTIARIMGKNPERKLSIRRILPTPRAGVEETPTSTPRAAAVGALSAAAAAPSFDDDIVSMGGYMYNHLNYFNHCY